MAKIKTAKQKPIIVIMTWDKWQEEITAKVRQQNNFTRQYESEEAIFTYKINKLIPHAYATTPILIDFELLSDLSRRDKKNGKLEHYLLYLGCGVQDSLRRQTLFANQFIEDISPELYTLMKEIYTMGTGKICIEP